MTSERWIPLDVTDCDESPFVQFHRWFDEAAVEMHEREAIALVTSTPDGYPSARMVLLRHVDATSFGWFTNYDSRKGQELRANPHAALLWYCEPLGRQIRIEGDVAPMSAAESDAYYQSRPRGHQLGAHASNQSALIGSRGELQARVNEVTQQFEGADVPRPENWGGFRLTPTRFEFWQHRRDRLHDRVLYTPDGSSWALHRQAP
jgi:pyridoxamine 5'-phosphate oxidase